MDAVWVSLVGGLVIALILGSFTYTFIVQRNVADKVETVEKDWIKSADSMRKSRDEQLSTLRAEAMAAISTNNVALFEQRLHAATTFATVKQLEQIETRVVAMIGKVEAKVDRLTDMVKQNGKHV